MTYPVDSAIQPLNNWGQEDKQKMRICYNHRHSLGKFWRSTKVTCQYPGNAGVRKRIQGRDVITLHISQDVQKLFGVIIPVGSGSPLQ